MSLSPSDTLNTTPEPTDSPVTLPRVAVDALGGDHAPYETVRGALLYAKRMAEGSVPPAQILLVGDTALVSAELEQALNGDPIPSAITLVPASQVIAMDEHPTEAVIKKQDSSLVVTTALVKRGEADAALSAGNTGAMMIAAIQILERIEGVRRPPIATFMPTVTGRRTVMVDSGANVDCKPSHILQFALLGSLYAQNVLGYENPRVGLLSNGEESSKGNEQTKETHALFAAKAKEYGLNFIGNVEGNHLFEGSVEVVACDGFVGNALLKGVEGMAHVNIAHLVEELVNTTDPDVRAVLEASLTRLRAKVDYAEAGGAPLLGVNGLTFIAHGRSDARAIMTGIKLAAIAAQAGYVARVREAFAALKAQGSAA